MTLYLQSRTLKLRPVLSALSSAKPETSSNPMRGLQLNQLPEPYLKFFGASQGEGEDCIALVTWIGNLSL